MYGNTVTRSGLVRRVAGAALVASAVSNVVLNVRRPSTGIDILPMGWEPLVVVGLSFVGATVIWLALGVRALRSATAHGYHGTSLLGGVVLLAIAVLNVAILLTVVT